MSSQGCAFRPANARHLGTKKVVLKAELVECKARDELDDDSKAIMRLDEEFSAVLAHSAWIC